MFLYYSYVLFYHCTLELLHHLNISRHEYNENHLEPQNVEISVKLKKTTMIRERVMTGNKPQRKHTKCIRAPKSTKITHIRQKHFSSTTDIEQSTKRAETNTEYINIYYVILFGLMYKFT